MTNEKLLLPVGSIVYLKGGTLKVIVIARGQLVQLKKDEKPTFFNYLGCLYPQGFDVENTYYFNQEDIEEVLFTGYQDEEERRYIKVLEEWKDTHSDDYEVGKVKSDGKEG